MMQTTDPGKGNDLPETGRLRQSHPPKGLDQKNPIDHFREVLARIVRKRGLNPNHFVEQVRSTRIGPYGDGKIKLSLSNKGEINAFLKSRLKTFLDEIEVGNL